MASYYEVGDLTQAILHEHSFTHGLPAARIKVLSAIANEIHFQGGEVILTKGEISTGLYMVVQGRLAVELTIGHATVRVKTLTSGDIFGWSVFLDKQETLFQVRAMEDIIALYVSRELLAAACDADPYLAAELLRRTLHVAADRLKATEIALAEMYGVKS
jgi:CRP-like cAMP-binding protein